MRTSRSASVAALAVAVLAGCAAQSPPPSDPAQRIDSTASAPAVITPTVLTRAQAAERYRSLADAYRKARQPLDRALDREPIDMAAIRRGAATAATAYRARIAGLLDTPWPADVKPLVDDYVTKAAKGLNFLLTAAKAKSLTDILATASQDSTDAINAADTLVRVKLGLPTVDPP